MVTENEINELNVGDIVIISQYALTKEQYPYTLPCEFTISGVGLDGLLFIGEDDVEHYVNYDDVFVCWENYNIWNMMRHN